MLNKTILAIDDEKTCLEVITFALEGNGYRVFTAGTGEEGVNFLEQNNEKIDVILLDMMLPDMYGLKALEKIKKIRSAKSIPVIMQTGTSNYGDLKKAFKLGAVNYVIRKPYCRGDLIKAIEISLINKNTNKKRINIEKLTHSGAIQEIA